MEQLQQLIDNIVAKVAQEPTIKASVIFIGFFLSAYILNRFFASWCKSVLIKLHTDMDEDTVEAIKQPLFYSIILWGAASSVAILRLPDNASSTFYSILATIAIFIWLKFLLVISKTILRSLSLNPTKASVIHPKTLPLFENIAVVFLVAIATYYLFVAWHIDMTAWLASAGIVGIAVGFAAKDTLANLFSGVFIMADSPYKIGDYVVLDSGERGEVTRIGIRSTRILTRDDVEITVPNSVMGNTKIINESGGRHEKFRVRISAGVAYGSDIDLVREVLMKIAQKEPLACQDPEPKVRFRQFGNSSLNFELLCWVEQPALRGAIVDSLNTAIYKAFNEHAIEIPYPKQDVYIKQFPTIPKA
jgi:small-conductance mechanosensitive channel